MQTIDIIKREHQKLASVLYTLKHLAEEQASLSEEPPFKVYHGILHYIVSFLDRFHHPKENSHLFPAIMKCDSQANDLVHELGDEHKKGEKLMSQLLRALSAYEFLGEPAHPQFVKAVEAYVEFELSHVEKEEKLLLPMAEEKLSEEDWKKIDAVFLDHQDPMFGNERSKEFNDLLTILVSKTPAPYGLG